MAPLAARLVAPQSDSSKVLTKAVLRAAKFLGLTNRDISRVLGTSEASVSRFQTGRTISPETREGEMALLFLRLYRSLDALVGGDDMKARAWLHAANEHLGGRPADRLSTVEGIVDVVQYLDAMRGRL